MEQHKLASPAPASPSPASPPAHDRCAYVSHSGRRCRANSADLHTGLCRKHAARTHTDPDSADVSVELFGEGTPSFESFEEINSVLKNLVVLVAQGRISARRAGVITYSLSFILRGLQAIDKKADDDPPEIIIDIDSAAARWAKERELAQARERELAQAQAPAPDSRNCHEPIPEPAARRA